VPHKLGGVLVVGAVLVWLLVLPLVRKLVPWVLPSSMSDSRQHVFWSLVRQFCFLTWLGRTPAERPFIEVTQVSTVLFLLTLVIYVIPVWEFVPA